MGQTIHLRSPLGDFTLCGDSGDGIFLNEVPRMAEPSERVTCDNCIRIINAGTEYIEHIRKTDARRYRSSLRAVRKERQ